MKIVLLFFLFSFNAISAESVDRLILFETESPEKIGLRQANENKEIYLEKESMLRDKLDDSGMLGDLYYTASDKGRLSLAYHVSHDYEKLSKLQAIDFQILRRMNSYQDQWWGIQIKRVVGKFNAMAEEVEASSNHPNANSLDLRLDSDQSMTIFGLGLGYRFNILKDFFKSDRVFEQIMAYGNYIYHLDGSSDTKYQGYGLSAEYGIHKRITKVFLIGTKLSYSIASLTRPAESDEDKLDRSLVLKWTSIGLEIGYLF